MSGSCDDAEPATASRPAEDAPPLTAPRLEPQVFGPVLAPSLLAACDGNRHRALRSPRLASETFPGGWDRWTAATGADLPGLGDVRMFEHNAYMLEAAAAGLGVAVTAYAFAQADIDAARLAAPWGSQPLQTRFCLLRPALARSGRLDRLARWLVSEGRSASPPEP